jgi:hypothetical protein
MDSTVFVESLHSKLLLVQKVARNIALMLLLVSLLFPTLNEIINTQAQDTNQINPNTKVTVEKVRKDKTTQIEETTLEELKSDVDLANLNNFKHTEEAKQSQLELTPEKIQEIESSKAVFYQDQNALVDQSILASFGYSPEQIVLVEEMVNIYNSQNIKKLKVSIDEPKLSKNSFNIFTVRAQAACTPKAETKFEWWGFRSVLDGCAVNEAKWNYSQFAAIIGLWGLTPCSWICAVIAAYQAGIVGALEYQNNKCDGKGAILTVIQPGLWNVEPVC